MSNNDRYRRFNLRIPKEVFERLQEEADSHSHSMNAEIVQRLEWTLISPHFALHSPNGPEPLKSYSLREELAKIDQEIREIEEQQQRIKNEEIDIDDAYRSDFTDYVDERWKRLQEKRRSLLKKMSEEWVKRVISEMDVEEEREEEEGDAKRR